MTEMIVVAAVVMAVVEIVPVKECRREQPEKTMWLTLDAEMLDWSNGREKALKGGFNGVKSKWLIMARARVWAEELDGLMILEKIWATTRVEPKTGNFNGPKSPDDCLIV